MVLKICKKCKRFKEHKARGFCVNCYYKWKYKTNPKYREKSKQNCKKWQKENREHVNKYQREYSKIPYVKQKIREHQNRPKIKKKRELRLLKYSQKNNPSCIYQKNRWCTHKVNCIGVNGITTICKFKPRTKCKLFKPIYPNILKGLKNG